MKLDWNADGRRRKRKPRETWMNGVKRSMISKDTDDAEEK